MLSINGKQPVADKSAFIANSSDIIGEVYLAQNSSVWFNAVVRADLAPVSIGKYANVQDNATIHVDPNVPCIIGDYVTIGHNAVVHSAIIGDATLIGMNATILSGAKIGKGCIIGAGALVTENAQIPDNSVVVGVPAKVIKTVDNQKANTEHAIGYSQLAALYKANTAI